jgi:hypothetical protein
MFAGVIMPTFDMRILDEALIILHDTGALPLLQSAVYERLVLIVV